MAKTVKLSVRLLPELYATLASIAERGGFRSVPNFISTLLTRMAIETAIAKGEAERGAMPLDEVSEMFGGYTDAMPPLDAMPPDEGADIFRDEIAEMFGEYTDAETPRYGERTKRTRRREV